ncbi:MAG: glutamate--tRNA ligase [Candidatus Helarchaeota archaeon]
MNRDLNNLIRVYSLLNAVKHKGKASVKAVLKQMLAKYPEFRKKTSELAPLIQQIVAKVNELPFIEIQEEVEKLPSEFKVQKTREEKGELPPLPNAKPPIVMRLAPYPSGPLHIGNARMVILNDYYVKRYNGKLLLVFDDTIGSEEKIIVPEAYDLIIEGLDYLGIKVHKKFYKSDRIETTYKYCREALQRDFAYVCLCPADLWRENYKRKARACPHRSQPVEINVELWEKMLDGIYADGQAVVRLKTGMDQQDPAVRDPVMMRIARREHPRIGAKYIVWPLLEFSWAVDDHLLGITHILRGKDLYKEDFIERWVWHQFGWPLIAFQHYGLIQFQGLKLSKTYSRKKIEANEYIGWEDPRTWSLQSLDRRGIQPEALREAILALGLSMADIQYSPLDLYARNKKRVDNIANRYFFVANPIRLSIHGLPTEELIAHPLVHPEFPERGRRTLRVPVTDGTATVFIADSDRAVCQPNSIIRLKDLCNVKITRNTTEIEAEFHSQAMQYAREIKAPIIQWIPAHEHVKIRLFMPDGMLLHGLGEKTCSTLVKGQIIQFERVGIGKVNEISPTLLVFYAHK